MRIAHGVSMRFFVLSIWVNKLHLDAATQKISEQILGAD